MTAHLVRALGSTLAALVVAAAAPGPAGAAPSTLEAVERYETGLVRNSAPAIGDVDGDGRDDLAIGGEDGVLRVFDGGHLDAQVLAVSAVPPPAPGCTPQATPSAIDSTPVIADLDGDGSNEIVVGMGSTYVPNQNGGLIAFRSDGTPLWRWSSGIDKFNVWDPTTGATPDGWCEGVFSTPAIGDVDGDGSADVVFGGWDHHVHVLDGRTGAELAGFPFNNHDTIWSSPALHDVDGDGRDEIFIGGDDTPGSPGHFAGGQFHALDWSDGVVRQLWKRNPDEAVMGSVALGDLDGDGRAEVYVTTTLNYHTGDTRRVLAFHADDGSVVPGWPADLGAIVTGNVAIGDVDADGSDELVVGAWDGSVVAFDARAAEVWRTTLCCNPAAPALDGVGGDPVIADLDGDGDHDVAIGNGWSMHLLDGRTGQRFAEIAVGLSNDSSPAVLVAPDGSRSLITSGYSLPIRQQVLSRFELPASTSIAPWPQARGAGNGVPAAPACDDQLPDAPTSGPAHPDGYWILDRAGQITAFGDVADHGDAVSAIASAPGVSAVDVEPAVDGRGYYVLDSRGCVHAAGSAVPHGHVPPGVLAGGERPASISSIDGGYLVFTDRGRALAFGAARHRGDMAGTPLNGPVLGSAVTASGQGYTMVGSDGGIFAFGDARFHGSMGGRPLNEPVVGLVADPDGQGYWLIAADGGVFAFDAPFRGSVPGVLSPGARLNAPVVGGIPYGDGYAMIASDGGVFVFSDRRFRGSLGGDTLARPVVDIGAT